MDVGCFGCHNNASDLQPVPDAARLIEASETSFSNRLGSLEKFTVNVGIFSIGPLSKFADTALISRHVGFQQHLESTQLILSRYPPLIRLPTSTYNHQPSHPPSSTARDHQHLVSQCPTVPNARHTPAIPPPACRQAILTANVPLPPTFDTNLTA